MKYSFIATYYAGEIDSTNDTRIIKTPKKGIYYLAKLSTEKMSSSAQVWGAAKNLLEKMLESDERILSGKKEIQVTIEM